ncbi:MAG: hypothetical protein ACE5GF_08225, partial [Thermodesulfobacteriota bacterium]
MRKRISLVIVLAMLTATLFSGCAKKAIEEDITAESAESAEAAEMEQEVVEKEGVVSDTGPEEAALVEEEAPMVEGAAPE